MRNFIPAATLAAALLAAGPVSAHEFTLFYLVPAGTTETEIAEIESAFQIASHERDQHPDETSDGHLGGVDVHLSVIAMDADAMLITLQPDIVAVPRDWDARQTAVARFSETLVALPPHQDKAARYLSVAQAPDLRPLPEAYEFIHGEQPGEWARASYAMARLIDEAIRLHDGVTPRAAVQSALDENRNP